MMAKNRRPTRQVPAPSRSGERTPKNASGTATESGGSPAPAYSDVRQCWTIYDARTVGYVARRFLILSGRAIPLIDALTSDSINELRVHFLKLGLACYERSPNDDPKIVESWM